VLAAPDVDLIARTWQLDFEFLDPQRITLTVPGESRPITYWYMLYQVTNRTGQDVEYYPSFRLVTDTLDVTVGGDHISPMVYDAIAARHQAEFPFFVPASKVIGPLLQGEENARVSAAVFRAFDTEASAFAVYVSGLSGDVERLSNPAIGTGAKPADETPEAFILRRTLAIHYDLPGDPHTQSQAVPARRHREWVMR